MLWIYTWYMYIYINIFIRGKVIKNYDNFDLCIVYSDQNILIRLYWSGVYKPRRVVINISFTLSAIDRVIQTVADQNGNFFFFDIFF